MPLSEAKGPDRRALGDGAAPEVSQKIICPIRPIRPHYLGWM